MSAEAFLADRARRTEEALEAYIALWSDAPAQLVEVIRYSLFAGGKRLRPALALGAAEIVSGDGAAAMPAALALEMIHTYSLIHDDLPCMDDDDLRRGKPTAHKVYGDAKAILAGDALLTMAFAVLAQTDNAAVISEVARAAGAEGMVGGQMLDIEHEGSGLTVEQLKDIHVRKTGALIRVSVRAGAILGGAGGDALAKLTDYGESLGLAFQIADDILDVAGDETATGKRVGSDKAKGKATFPVLVGIDEARRLAVEAADAAVKALEDFGAEAQAFRDLARYVVERSW